MKANTPDFPVVPYTTVEQYREYMEGMPDDNSTVKHNPTPVDGMTLSDLSKKSRAEILQIVNEMGSVDNKSDRRIMYSHGLSCSWTELMTVAEFLGFINETPNKLKVRFSDPTPDEASAETKFNAIEISKAPDAYPVEKKLYLSKEANNKLKKIVTKTTTGKQFDNSTKSRILSAITESNIDAAYAAKKAGKLKIKVKEQEL